MNTGAHRRPRRGCGRLRRFAVRQPASVLLLLALPLNIAGLALFITGSPAHHARLSMVAGIVVLMLSPTLLFGTALYAPRGVRAVWRRLVDWHARRTMRPTNPPIERLAADLRRLLWQHDRVERSIDGTMRTLRLRALEETITDCATQAARALDVLRPDRPAHGRFDKAQLRQLLHALANAGLALPPEVGLLSPDTRL